MIRNSKTPTFIMIGCVVFSLILMFNYWRASNNTNNLRNNLLSTEEKLNSLIVKKSHLEKMTNEYEEKMKFLEKKVSDNSQLLLQKDSEMSEVVNKLNVAKDEVKQEKDLNWNNISKMNSEHEEAMLELKNKTQISIDEIEKLRKKLADANEKMNSLQEKLKLCQTITTEKVKEIVEKNSYLTTLESGNTKSTEISALTSKKNSEPSLTADNRQTEQQKETLEKVQLRENSEEKKIETTNTL